MEAGKKSLSEILNRMTILKIPHFQRAYVWEEDQWSRFLEDLKYVSRTGTPYFMGSVILKQQETTIGSNEVRTVVDGQQRLTTFFIFFRALMEINNQIEKLKEICFSHNGVLLLDHNYLDSDIFIKLMNGSELNDREKKKSIPSCYKFFKENLNCGEIDPHMLLGRIKFVGIDLQKEDDEQQIFDTINSLGVSLTTSELLKNYLFKDDIDAYIDNWRTVFEDNDEQRDYWEQEVTLGRNKRSNIDIFLQSYLFIKVYDPVINVRSEDKERYIKIDSVFNSFKELMSNYVIDKAEVIREIKEFAAVYKKVIDPSIEGQVFERDEYDRRINFVMFGLETVTIIPYVVFISKYSTEADSMEIFKYLETYIIRRMICRLSTKNYNQLFRSLINAQIKDLVTLKEFINNKSEKINHMPSDEELMNGFNESQLTNKQTKGILYLLEKSVHGVNNATELRSANKYSLEHVMPKMWRNNWHFQELSEDQKSDLDKQLLTLGNLTIITQSLNASIRDSNWEIKKNGRNGNRGLIEYAAGIEIFNKYLEREKWDGGVIRERATYFYETAKNAVWPLL